jgi:hypothetical protein
MWDSIAGCVRGCLETCGNAVCLYTGGHIQDRQCCRGVRANRRSHPVSCCYLCSNGCSMAATAPSELEHGASHTPAQHTAHGMHALITPPPGLCAPAAVCASHQQRPPAHHTRWRGPAARCTPSRRQPPAQTPPCTSSSSHGSTGMVVIVSWQAAVLYLHSCTSKHA